MVTIAPGLRGSISKNPQEALSNSNALLVNVIKEMMLFTNLFEIL